MEARPYDDVKDKIRKLAYELFANLPISVYLYGSRARGDASTDSDWDLLIVMDDSVVTMELAERHNLTESGAPLARRSFNEFAYPFIELGWDLEEQITPLLYTKSQWDAERNTLFYLNVQTDAILLNP